MTTHDTEVEELLEEYSEYIEQVSFGQYDDKGVNIGFIPLKQLIAETHQHQLQKATESFIEAYWTHLHSCTTGKSEDGKVLYIKVDREHFEQSLKSVETVKARQLQKARTEERERAIEIVKDELRTAPLEVQMTKGIVFASIVGRIQTELNQPTNNQTL